SKLCYFHLAKARDLRCKRAVYVKVMIIKFLFVLWLFVQCNYLCHSPSSSLYIIVETGFIASNGFLQLLQYRMLRQAVGPKMLSIVTYVEPQYGQSTCQLPSSSKCS